LGFGSGVSRIAVLLSLLVASTAFARPPQEGEAIQISRRPWFAICAGVCPNYHVAVRPDGAVLVLRRNFDSVDEVMSFRVSPARLARFRAILAAYRPTDDTPEPSRCEHDVRPEEAALVRDAVEIEVKWTGAAGSDHLVACDTQENAALREAIGAALQSLGIAADGRRRL
jgi:hypothetical protein